MFWRCEVDIAAVVMYNLSKKNRNLQPKAVLFTLPLASSLTLLKSHSLLSLTEILI